MSKILNNINELSKHFIREVVKPGDRVIDGTAGNGYDTIFLAKAVSDQGKVYSFDIQKEAIEKTRERLLSEGLSHVVQLLPFGHQEIEKHIEESISAAMFNLGYLPGGDHRITTRGSTTVEALEQTMKLLRPGGRISICIYYGHPGGREELDEILAFAKTIDYKYYNVVKVDFYNKINCPPQFILIEKKNH